jgi:hypothetical protein
MMIDYKIKNILLQLFACQDQRTRVTRVQFGEMIDQINLRERQ